MNMQSVKSSNIRAIGYESNTLRVEFASGAIYDYSDVPYATYSALMAAESIGKFFGQFVRSTFKATRVDTKEAA